MNILRDQLDPDAFDVRVSEFLVATHDASDALIDQAVPEVLRLLREKLAMDVAFVSEFTGGRRVYRHVDAAPNAAVFAAGDSDPIEKTFCKLVVEGRVPPLVRDFKADPATSGLPAAPFPIGSYLSVPVVLSDGQVYGTLCCFSFSPRHDLADDQLRKLEMSARLAGRRIEEMRARAQRRA